MISILEIFSGTYISYNNITEFANPKSTLSHIAVAFDSIRKIENVIQIPEYIDLEDSCGTKPLHLAAQHGDFETVERLLDAGVTINTISQFCLIPLERETSTGNTNLLRILLERGVNVGNDI